MRTEIKKWRWKCDRCGKEEVIESSEQRLPMGWKKKFHMIKDGFMERGYTYEEDLCPNCKGGDSS